MATRTGDGDIGSGLKYDVLKRLVLRKCGRDCRRLPRNRRANAILPARLALAKRVRHFANHVDMEQAIVEASTRHLHVVGGGRGHIAGRSRMADLLLMIPTLGGGCGQRQPNRNLPAVWFAPDSLLEGDGFEPSVPRQRRRLLRPLITSPAIAFRLRQPFHCRIHSVAIR
jgi:hypothetical protein